MDYYNCGLPGFVVPQKVYQAQQPYSRLPPVKFSEYESMGVKLQNALNQPPRGMPDGEKTPLLAEKAKKITLRINVSAEFLYHNIALTCRSGRATPDGLI